MPFFGFLRPNGKPFWRNGKPSWQSTLPGYIKAVATGRTLIESIVNAVFEYNNKQSALWE
jgi:hypothetical protein